MTIAAMLSRLAGRRVVASVSGGKDSAALSLHLTELGIEHDRIFFDTGWEHPKTYEYLRGELTSVIGPITELRGRWGMEALIRKKAMFPSKSRRFCTEELKVFPVRNYLGSLMDAGRDVVNAVGIRRAESEKRKLMAEWEWQEGFDCEVWRPLVDWSLDDVIAIHKRHGLAPNPLYLMGMDRVGCWPCIHSNKGEIRKMAEVDPDRVVQIRKLETEVAVAARTRYEERVSRYRAGGLAALKPREREFMFDADGNLKPFHAPEFFQSPLKEEGGTNWPIDRVVAWSRTKRGGRVEDKQADLLAPGGVNDGCMRWGMCETSLGNKE